MKVWVLSLSTYAGTHIGYSFWPTEKAANAGLRKIQEENNDIESDLKMIECHPTKIGIIRLLNIHASHPDNG